MSAPLTPGQRLAEQAAEAAEVRTWQTHPDVIALQVEKTRTNVDRMIWGGIVLGLAFTMTNVQQFVATTTHATIHTLGWWSAWLLDPTVAAILLGVLVAERRVSPGQIRLGDWPRFAKWALLSATYVMNTWESYATGNTAGIVLHSVPPLVVFFAAEAVTDCHDKLTLYVERAVAGARSTRPVPTRVEVERSDPFHPGSPERSDAPELPAPDPAERSETFPDRGTVLALRPAAERFPDHTESDPASDPFRPVPTRSTVLASVPDPERSDPHPVTVERPEPDPVPTRPVITERSDDPTRDDPGTERDDTPERSDRDLLISIKSMAKKTGKTPSIYAVKNQLEIGSSRASRLLAEFTARGSRRSA